MTINLFRGLNLTTNVEAVFKATEASEEFQIGRVATVSDSNVNYKDLMIGLNKWIDGEHGEEEILRQSCCTIIDYARKNGLKNIIIDIISFSEYYVELSYITNTLIEELSNISDKEDLTDYTIGLLISEYEYSERLLDELDDELSKPVFETVNHSYGDYGDPLKEQFREFQKSLGQEKIFREYLVDLMDKKGIRKNTEVYKPSGISKYTFSRLTNFSINPPHKPSKETVAALAIGLKLRLDEAEEFYGVAGYCLTKTEFIDKVIRFFIFKKIYNIDEVNFCLANHGYPLLGERVRGESTNIIIK